MISLKSKREIKIMQTASSILREVFVEVQKIIEPGITTEELDRVGEKVIRGHGGKPAFKGYRGFPKTACISVNEEVVHGIPGARVLNEGDIVSFDVGAQVEGYFADAARTWPVGNATEDKIRLIESSKKALEAGLAAYTTGCRIGDLSESIQKSIEADGYQVVRDYVGHGIGRTIHEEPQVPNYGKKGQGPKIEAGLVLAIEPMVTEGHYTVETLEDGWTVVTKDRKLSSHYEDNIVFFEDRYVNMTGGEPFEG